MIMTDDQGYGDYSCHGNPWLKTANLDALQKQSTTFSNFHVGTTCSPTRAGLLSGMHCNRTGTWHTVNGRSFLTTRYRTIADYLKEAGYHTSIFGKWHLGDNYPFRPQDRGFDEVLVHGGGGVGQGPDHWGNDYFDDSYLHNGELKSYPGFCADVWFDEAIKYMESQSSKEQPFFCYISSNTPHGPHYAPEKYIKPFEGNEDVVNPGFYGQIANIDDNMGKLMSALDRLQLDQNTILIYTNDNGTAAGVKLGEGGHVVKGYNAGMRGQKASMYEGGHRVGLFMRFPEMMNIPIEDHTELVNYTDMVPTILDIVGHGKGTSTEFDGESIASLLNKGQQSSLDDRIVIVDTQRSDLPVKWKKSCVMQQQWRLINNAELYDLSEDPGQKMNVIDEHPELANNLATAYEAWWNDQVDEHAFDNRIIVGSDYENPSLLMSHDWHTEKNPPWHQSHVRSAMISNGYWSLQVERPGNYEIRLFRWPPSSNVKSSESLDEIGTWKKGVALQLEKARIEIQGQVLESSNQTDESFFAFEADLTVGAADFQSWLIDKEGVERGAYFAEVEFIN